MLLITLKDYVQGKGMVSLFELTTHFRIESEVMREMLNFLIRKGKVRQKTKTMNCGTKCIKCPSSTTEMYEWV